MRQLFATIIFIALAVSGMAQKFSIKRIMTDNGLSSNYVVSIAHDKQGRIWIATEEGLNCFDGNDLSTFYKGPDNSISGNELNCILDDPKDSVLWIATQRSGLDCLDYTQNRFTVYRPDSTDGSLSSEAVTKVTPSSDGSIWVSTYWSGVDYFDKKTHHFVHHNSKTVPGWTDDNIWTAVEDCQHHLYVGYYHQGLGIYDINNKTFRQFLHSDNDPESIPDNEVLSIHVDRNQNVWVGTRKGLALFDPVNGKFHNFSFIGQIGHNPVFDIRMTEDHCLWVALEQGGIVRIEIPQGQFNSPNSVRYTVIPDGYSDYTLSGNSVRCVSEDRFGNIWAGVWSGGANFISRVGNLFECYTYTPSATMETDRPTGLNCRGVLAVTADNDDRLWIGTDGGGINVIDNGQRTAIHNVSNSHIPTNCVQAAYRDNNGNLWFGMFYAGISVYNVRTGQFANPLPDNLKKMDVRGFCALDDKEILIASSNGIYKADISTYKITGHYDLPQNLVRTIMRDSFGNIWVGTFGGGLYILDINMKVIETFNTSLNFPSNTVNHIIEDSHQHVWVATGEGMVLFESHDKFSYRVFGRSDGLANLCIRAISEDKSGNIWMATNSGISCYIEGEGRIENYDSRDRLPSGSFTSAATVRTSDGSISFGSTGGLCKFSPSRVLTTETAPMAVFKRMKVFLPVSQDMSDDISTNNNQLLLTNLRDGVELEYTENNFTVSVTTENYAYASLVEYACKLEGVEKEYYTISDPGNIVFRNLSPGNYRLLVKTRFKNQAWGDEASALEISILPPWYASTIAKTLWVILILSAILMIFLMYRRRVKMSSQLKLEKQNREKQDALNEERMRFFTNIAHELRTPLSLIVGPLEDICADSTLPQQTSQKLKVINNSSQQLLKLTNYLLDFRKTETHNKRLCVSRGLLDQLVEDVVNKYKELKRNNNVELSYYIEPDGDFEILFDRESIITILDNLITNSLKYTEKGYIKVSLSKSGTNAVICVEDTGYGISPEALPHIFDRYYQEQGPHQASGTGIGLSLVKNLAELHKGSIKAESTLGKGSKFSLSIPLDEPYADALHTDPLKEIQQEEVVDKQEPLMVQADNTDKQLILVVEDNIDIQDYIKNSLSDQFRIITANNGKEGTQTALRETPDIIVSDIMMPVMDGVQLCKNIKNDIRTSHIPVVLLTAKDSMKDKTEGYEAGADSYITKPFSATLLRTRILNLLDRQKQMAKYFSNTNADSSDQMKSKHDEFMSQLSKLDTEFLSKVDSMIETDMESQDVNVSAISQKLCMSTSTLYRKIKALTGVSTNEYIRKVKMKNAERLLMEGRYSISEIAYKVGINSEVYFRQCFKDEYGMAPSEYLKKLEGKQD